MPFPSRNPRVRWLLILVAVGLFILSYYWGNRYQYGRLPDIEGVLIAPAMPLPGFALEDTEGRAFTARHLNDRWTLLAFGEIASARGQLAVTRMLAVANRLADRPRLRESLQLVLAAPVHAPNTARDFTRLSPILRLVVGDPDELARLATPLGEAPDGRGETQAALYLIAPGGDLLALFAASQPPETLAADLAALASRPPELFAVPRDE